jgi:hypothetical protein
MGNFICSDFLRRIKTSDMGSSVGAQPASMQHISSFIRTSTTSSLFIHNRDKRRSKLCSIIMIASLIMTVLFAPFTTMAEAPTDETTIPTTTNTSASAEGSITPTEVLPEIKLVDGLTVEQRAAKIDAFYAKKGNLPLTGQGIMFVKYADKYDIDWRLVASKAYHESTAGKFACRKDKYNVFGWGSCRGEKFDSYEDAIETVSRNLGGHNPNTSYFYKGKSVDEIIDAYNPPSVRANYKKLIKGTMNAIAKTEVPDIAPKLAVK